MSGRVEPGTVMVEPGTVMVLKSPCRHLARGERVAVVDSRRATGWPYHLCRSTDRNIEEWVPAQLLALPMLLEIGVEKNAEDEINTDQSAGQAAGETAAPTPGAG